MSYIRISNTFPIEAKAMRDVYCEVMMELAQNNRDIIVMDADLMNSIGMVPFAKQFPEQTLNCGIQEANMVGVAAGLSSMGKIPYLHTFGTFATRRVADQIFVSCAFAKANVRIIGSDPGVTAAFNGGTHMPFEDIGIMRTIPGVTIIEPTDSVMLADIVRQLSRAEGVFYIRLSRKNAVKVFEDSSTFEIGKAVKVLEGTDVTIMANGIMVAEAVQAAQLLKSEGISAAVLNPFTIKPIDVPSVIDAARSTGAVVTAENHNIIGGLGSAVAEILCEYAPVPMKRVGVEDSFGEVGSVEYLKERFGLTAQNIAAQAKEVVARKQGASCK